MRAAVGFTAVAALVAVGSTGASVQPPRLVLLETKPAVELAGRYFKPAEHVRVTAELGKGTRSSRLVSAGRTGRFTVVVGRIVDPCVFGARATGSRGSKAALKIPTELSERMCPVPLDSGGP